MVKNPGRKRRQARNKTISNLLSTKYIEGNKMSLFPFLFFLTFMRLGYIIKLTTANQKENFIMEYQMHGHIKLCGTCEFWVGPRQPNFYGNAAVLPEQSVKGKCFCLEGPHKRADRFSNHSTCFYYKKWSVLK